MATKRLRFFSPQDDVDTTPKTKQKAEKAVSLGGTISARGKLIFALKTLEHLGLDPATTHFKVGVEEGKKKPTSLYLFPADGGDNTFALGKAGRSYGLTLAGVLRSLGVEFAGTKHDVTMKPYTDESGQEGFKIRWKQPEPKVKRPRRKKGEAAAE